MVKNLKLSRFRFLLMLLIFTMSTLLFFAFESNQVFRGKPKLRIDPNMAYVSGGSYYMGASDEQVDNSLMNHKKLVSVSSFWMDKTEITNEQYHKFVNYVADSLKYLNYYLKTIDIPDDDTLKVDWNKVSSMNRNIANAKTQKSIEDLLSSKLTELVLPQQDRMKGHPLQLDPKKMVYRYYFVDLKKAADTSASRKGLVNAKYLFKVTKNEAIYPDTLVWGRDFSMSQNDPLMIMYFSHKSYYEYPVVGVTWKQATAFCHWRTEHSDYFQGRPGKKDYIIEGVYRLPSEAEWEYAARGNAKINAMYPWGAPFARTKEGRLMANFKPGRGDYFGGNTKIDGITPVKVRSYSENGFGLFDMAGNVAEWTSTVFDESGGPADFNPNFQYDVDETIEVSDPRSRKSIRGGSWKDIAYNCQVSTRNYEYQFNAKSYIGFRCVLSAPPKY